MDIRNTRAIKSLRVNGNVMFSGDIVPVIKGRIGVIDRLRINECCHRHDFLVRLIGTDLLFLNFLNFYSSLGIDHDPHVLYDSCSL